MAARRDRKSNALIFDPDPPSDEDIRINKLILVIEVLIKKLGPEYEYLLDQLKEV